jgi:hypothetical protein
MQMPVMPMAEYAHPEFVAPYSAPVDEQEGEVILLGSAFSSSSSSKGRLGQALSEMQGTSPNTAFSQPAQQQKQKPVLLQQRGFLQQVPLKPQQQQQQQQSLPVQQQLTEDQQQQQPTPVPAQQAVPLPAQQQQQQQQAMSTAPVKAPVTTPTKAPTPPKVEEKPAVGAPAPVQAPMPGQLPAAKGDKPLPATAALVAAPPLSRKVETKPVAATAPVQQQPEPVAAAPAEMKQAAPVAVAPVLLKQAPAAVVPVQQKPGAQQSAAPAAAPAAKPAAVEANTQSTSSSSSLLARPLAAVRRVVRRYISAAEPLSNDELTARAVKVATLGVLKAADLANGIEVDAETV